jgi:hypothetical protein
MRFNFSLLADKADSAFPNLSQSLAAADAIVAARASIEREFSALANQQPRLLHLALNEAEALAWETGFPELVFPILAEEKAGQVSSWQARQQFVRQNGPMQAFAA